MCSTPRHPIICAMQDTQSYVLPSKTPNQRCSDNLYSTCPRQLLKGAYRSNIHSGKVFVKSASNKELSFFQLNQCTIKPPGYTSAGVCPCQNSHIQQQLDIQTISGKTSNFRPLRSLSNAPPFELNHRSFPHPIVWHSGPPSRHCIKSVLPNSILHLTQ